MVTAHIRRLSLERITNGCSNFMIMFVLRFCMTTGLWLLRTQVRADCRQHETPALTK